MSVWSSKHQYQHRSDDFSNKEPPMENLVYSVAGVIMLIVAFMLLKRVASCMIKALLLLVIVAILTAIYYMYLH